MPLRWSVLKGFVSGFYGILCSPLGRVFDNLWRNIRVGSN